MREFPHQIKFVSVSELNIAKLKKIKFQTEEQPLKKFQNKNTKNKVELSTEFWISFCLFFITFIILSILGTLQSQFLCGVQKTKKDFFRVKKDFFRVKKDFFFKVFLFIKKTCIFTSFYLYLKF